MCTHIYHYICVSLCASISGLHEYEPLVAYVHRHQLVYFVNRSQD